MKKQKRKFGSNYKRDFDALTVNGRTIVFPEKLKAKYGLTDEEIDFLSKLEVFAENEYLPVRVNGKKNGVAVFAPPISVAVFDYFYGAQIQISIEKHMNDYLLNLSGITGVRYINVEKEFYMSLAKSIFKKVSPELYAQCF